MSNRKPYNNLAGYKASLRSGPLQSDGKRGWVVIYDAKLAGLCALGGRWATVCETHSTIANHTNLPTARKFMKSGSHNWCEECVNQ